MPHYKDATASDSIDDLVARAHTDREAFGRLYDVFYPGIFRYCMRRLFVREAAEDATANVFLNVAVKMRAFGGTSEEDFRRWVYKIATNEINAVIRRSKRQNNLMQAGMHNKTLQQKGNPHGDSPTPELLDWPVLYQAIAELNLREQTIISLRFFEQMSHEQIAGVLDEHPGTIRAVLSRALEKLRRKFKIDDNTARVKP